MHIAEAEIVLTKPNEFPRLSFPRWKGLQASHRGAKGTDHFANFHFLCFI